MQECIMINCIMDHYLVIKTIVQINNKQNILIQSIRMNNYIRFKNKSYSN